jgi:hypothetical protein
MNQTIQQELRNMPLKELKEVEQEVRRLIWLESSSMKFVKKEE